ncbi:MAG: aminotransferase class III-fold pyridoxal phosphate-dependent enzyme, partial [Actinobacteria bacterium]|nr:aminotransferase class III-fold pyridoxal phosphate-dependent enzyme [Actinomycetota bacterium]
MSRVISPARIAELMKIEEQRFLDTHKASTAAFTESSRVMHEGVPMSWMAKWPGAHPVFIKEAKGAHFTDLDGQDYIDFCLGDTGSMTGHSPAATVAAVKAQIDKGITAMLPSENASIVSDLLRKRFGLPLWQFTVSATDANRHVIRYSRMITGRDKIVVIDRCYHGSVDETFATLDDAGFTIKREGNIGAPVDLDVTTRVVEFNDLPAMEAALAKGDVAAILMEPAMTNIGIVLPEPGYLNGVEDLCKKYGTLLIIDETHTISVGAGGMTAQLGLKPDFFTIGKALAAGIPVGTFGMTQAVADAIKARVEIEKIDTGGIGGTLAGNILALAAMRATLTDVLTEGNFTKMVALGDRWSDGVDAAIKEFDLDWHCNRLGARGEYIFKGKAPRTGKEAADSGDFALEQYIHLRLL